MNLRFITFRPYTEETNRRLVVHSATEQLNNWLEQNPNAEITDWKPFSIDDKGTYYITISYKIV